MTAAKKEATWHKSSRNRSFAEVMSQLRDRLFRYGGPVQGAVLLTVDGIEAGTGFHFLVLGDTGTEVLAQGRKIAALLREGGTCAGSMDSARQNRPKSNAHENLSGGFWGFIFRR